MRLSRSSGQTIRQPSISDLESALSELDAPDGYLILAQAEEEYVQAGGGALEYRDATGHYRAEPAPGREHVRAVFADYLARRPGWKSNVPAWREVSVEIEHRRPRRSWLAALLAVGITAGAWLIYRLFF